MDFMTLFYPKYPIFQYCISLSIRYTRTYTVQCTLIRNYEYIGIDQVASDVALKLIALIE